VDIELLNTFLEVHKTRHFGKAAENLYVTSAAVSARVKLLEQQLGVALFLRNRRDVQLTSDGERLLPHAETLVLAWTRTLQELAIQAPVNARLHVGATDSMWQVSLQGKLEALAHTLPELSLQAEGHHDMELVRRLDEKLLDLIIIAEPPPEPQFRSIKVGQMKVVLASTDETATVESSILEGYIYVDWGPMFSSFHRKKIGKVPVSALHVNMATIATNFLRRNKGAAYLPQSFVATHPWLFVVKGAAPFNRSVYASWRDGTERLEEITKIVHVLQGISV
jgi:LysR family transcriptional regulator, flagellar master operon regulator